MCRRSCASARADLRLHCRQRSNGLFLQAEELRIMKEQTEKAAQAASKEKVVRIALCQSARAATSPVLL